MILRPSGAHRWGPGACPGSPAMEAHFPEDTDSEAAREGTAAHFYATERLAGRVHMVGTLAPNGYPLDQDMIDGGDLLCETVHGLLRQCGPRAQVLIEYKLTAHGLVHVQNEGTPDVIIMDFDTHRCIVIDYKYGHRYVEEWRHWQIVNYFACAFEASDLDLQDVKGWECLGVIVQPRYYAAEPVRTWKTLGHEMWAHIQTLAAAAELAATPDAPTQSGPHCRDCRAEFACEANAKAGASSAEYAGRSTPLDRDAVSLAYELRMLTVASKRLDARKAALEEIVEAKLRARENLPLWELGPGVSRLKWVRPVPEVLAIGDVMGVNLRNPNAILTPTQAASAGLDQGIIDGFAERPPAKMKLTLIDEAAMAKRFRK